MKPLKQQSVGVEITREWVRIVALGSGKKPVYAQSFPNPGGFSDWASTLRGALDQVFTGKAFPKKLGLALNFKSQQTLLVRPSASNPDLESYLSWYNELYTGLPATDFVLEYSSVESKSRVALNSVSLRPDEISEIKTQLESAQLIPSVLDSSVFASINAALQSTKERDLIVIKLDHVRSTWVAVREGALQYWSDFAVSSEPSDSTYWLERLREKLQELQVKWPSRPVFVTGEMLQDTSVADVLKSEFPEFAVIEPLKALGFNSYQSASYAAAWAMALRAGDEK